MFTYPSRPNTRLLWEPLRCKRKFGVRKLHLHASKHAASDASGGGMGPGAAAFQTDLHAARRRALRARDGR